MLTRNLDRFLRSQLFADRSDPLSHFELRHAASGSKGNIVDEFRTVDVNPDNVGMLVDEVINRAQNDADGIGGVQRYELIAVIKGESKKTVARLAFRIRGEDDSMDEGGSGEESATGKGLLTQLMRHNEASNRTLVQGMGQMVAMMSRKMELDSNRIEQLLEERSENLKQIEAAKTQEHEREMELLQESKKQDRIDTIVEKANMLFPIMVNKISGKKVLNEEENSILKGFVNSLTQEQFQAIAGTLKPEQQIILFSVVNQIKGDQKILPPSSS